MFTRIVFFLLLLSPSLVSGETIAVIGTGNVGMALGTEFGGLGHTVIYGSRSPLSMKSLDLVAKTGKDSSAKRPADAAAAADIIVLAVPGMVTEEIVKGLGDLSGKIIIDVGGIYHARVTEHMVVMMLNNSFSGAEKFDVIFQRRD